ncbi:hypothetical protein GGR57DRAFT_270116 [Xylariaceae sp. FL1272]|nr:hypothetical protein GGR57DRAFT_270116 [Xylariaceae sp. FL1272]
MTDISKTQDLEAVMSSGPDVVLDDPHPTGSSTQPSSERPTSETSGAASDMTDSPDATSPDASGDPECDAASDVDMDGDGDGTSSVCLSTTSTVQHRQEPAAELIARATQLMYLDIWPIKTGHYITSEKLTSGWWNRVIKFSLHCRKPVALGDYSPQYSPSLEDAAWVEPAPEWYARQRTQTIRECVLRVPRSPATPNTTGKPRPRFREGQHVDYDAAILHFVQTNTNIPVPSVLTLDKSDKNILGTPYMVQEFVSGEKLEYAYQRLGHQDRCRLAKELGAIYREMLSVRSRAPGRVVSYRMHKFLNRESFRITPLHPTYPVQTSRFASATPTKSVKDFLLQSMDAVMRQDTDKDGFTYFKEDWKKLKMIVEEMDEDGLFSDVHFALSHNDLQPHNILIDRLACSEKPVISAVIDWDTATLSPAFVACEPPFWLWGWAEGVWDDTCWECEEDMAEDRILEINEPKTPEGAELKTLFDTSAGADYCRFAYNPQYRLARKLMEVVTSGFFECHARMWADLVLENWPTVRASGSSRITDDISDTSSD